MFANSLGRGTGARWQGWLRCGADVAERSRSRLGQLCRGDAKQHVARLGAGDFCWKCNKVYLPNVNINEVVLRAKTIDKQGNESPVAAYVSPSYRQRKIETY